MEKLPLDRMRWPFIALLASAAMLATAYAVEYLLFFAPCQMCYWQRYVYWGAGGLGLLAIALNWRAPQPRLMAAMCMLIGVVFLGGAFIASWHALVEWKVLPPLGGCVATGPLNVSGDLWEQLGNRIAVPSCDKAPFHVLGLSMAGWNAIASVILAGASFFAATRTVRTDTANEPVKPGAEGMGADA